MEFATYYRIARGQFRSDLSGKGAELFGGRWNSIGTPAVYAAETISLALLEILVQAKARPVGYYVMALDVPKDQVLSIHAAELPGRWSDRTDQATSQAFAMQHLFAANRFGILVPSVVVPEEFNLVLNPLHPLMAKATLRELRPLNPDPRL